MELLKDKAVLVTGAGNGIGAAAADCFARHGARVLVSDMDRAAAEAVAEGLRRQGRDAFAMQVDVTQEQQVADMVATAVDRFGRLDGAFNNAGIGCRSAPTAEHELTEWRRLLEVNVVGSWLCLKYEIDAMMKTGGGSIVANASDAGLLGVRNLAPYAATKAALINLIRCAAIEYGDHSIRLNAVCPGATNTPALRNMAERNGISIGAIIGRRPINRPGEPSEIAEAAAWLLSPLASFVTGQALSVDGGFNAAFT